ncbi:T9SS type A sorting domain-containing protein [Dyadobacter sp. CY312]|uniref:T9SS type A sorting domain-containing protein n=1 Tax=Dyadobacter sp. CY312 TaxID=2907303 RepID=UPI001F3D13BE|nr:T9SS type A sorting domain-containing protein [Dyadobacter sp. CY312]MCE7042892.1 T9SS type A sorting domain-containing protein [Dyadobacter sp. CY312]
MVSDCVFSFNAGYNGGGLVNSGRRVSVINNRFEHNRAVFGGGLLSSFIASTTVSDCFFYENAGMGGGTYVYGSGNKSTFTHCIFQGNTGTGSAGGITLTLSASAKIYASAFINNKGMGLGHSILAAQVDDTMTLDGCIFTNSTTGSDDEIQLRSGINIISNCSVVGNVDVFPAAVSTVRFRNNLFASITNFSGLSSNNLLGGNPLYVNASNPAGPDSIYFTPDDGLRLQCGSPAINAGSDTATITDIIGITRVGKPDIGAYEATDTINVITAISSSARAFQSNATVYGDCDRIIARVTTWGAAPIIDSTTAKVWVESSAPATWVKRHYEITPDNNAATATGRVTLFFSQAEFNAFNALNINKLPNGSLDATGKANLLIEKRPGTSNNGSGLPGTYSGTPVTIDPSDSDIVWNNQMSRWEVTVNVLGFSGFFVKTSETPLPVKWLSISGRLNTRKQAVISWQVAEHSVTDYDVEGSRDAREFTRIALIQSNGNGENRYSFTDPNTYTGNRYYRIRQTDNDGTYSYSSIINISAEGKPVAAYLYPNPATTTVTLETDHNLLNTAARLINMSGIIVRQWVIRDQQTSLDLSGLSAGIYILKLTDGQVIRVTKQ